MAKLTQTGISGIEMKALLDAFWIGLLSAVVIPLLDYILSVYAEQPPVRCDGGEEKDWIDKLEEQLQSR